MIIQVCLPDKMVAFEDVEVELKGVANAKTLREERAANGHLETVAIRKTTFITAPQTDPNRVTVRRWILGSGASHLKRSSLGFGEILNRDEIRSSTSSTIGLYNNSERNQPVFEKKGHRLNDTLALNLATEVDNEIVTYWYKPPGQIPKDQLLIGKHRSLRSQREIK